MATHRLIITFAQGQKGGGNTTIVVFESLVLNNGLLLYWLLRLERCDVHVFSRIRAARGEQDLLLRVALVTGVVYGSEQRLPCSSSFVAP